MKTRKIQLQPVHVITIEQLLYKYAVVLTHLGVSIIHRPVGAAMILIGHASQRRIITHKLTNHGVTFAFKSVSIVHSNIQPGGYPSLATAFDGSSGVINPALLEQETIVKPPAIGGDFAGQAGSKPWLVVWRFRVKAFPHGLPDLRLVTFGSLGIDTTEITTDIAIGQKIDVGVDLLTSHIVRTMTAQKKVDGIIVQQALNLTGHGHSLG